MAVMVIHHMNAIGHEINESLEQGYPASDREIFCKKLHKVTEPNASDCETCPYFSGWMQGHGIECAWEDASMFKDTEVFVPHEDAQKELLRVSKLIDEGIIKKG